MRLTNEGEAGTVVVVTSHLGRYGDFEVSLEQVIAPAGTKLLRVKGGSSARNQNVGVQQRSGGWVWFMDDDHTFQPDVLMRLLAHGKDIVAPLVPMRFPPYNLVLYKQLDMTEQNGKVEGFAEQFYTVDDLAGVTGLLPVQGLPKAGCLIREAVWATMPMPIFKVGLIHPDDIEDDKYFMWELREKYGHTLWCDTDQSLAHLTTVAISCRREGDGRYQRAISVV